MFHAAIQVLLYGLLAGLSPLALAATLAVMPAGRLKALGFGTGFVGAQALTCSVFVIIGIAATGASRKSHTGIQATLEILLAIALIMLAVGIRRRPPTAKESSNPRTPGGAGATQPLAFPHNRRRRIRARDRWSEATAAHQPRRDDDRHHGRR
jgi:Na+/melibiose symporter-like transporter